MDQKEASAKFNLKLQETRQRLSATGQRHPPYDVVQRVDIKKLEPVPFLCAAPNCDQVATGRCSKCRQVRYCSVSHQAQDWKRRHKDMCGRELQRHEIADQLRLHSCGVLQELIARGCDLRSRGDFFTSAGIYLTMMEEQKNKHSIQADKSLCYAAQQGIIDPSMADLFVMWDHACSHARDPTYFILLLKYGDPSAASYDDLLPYFVTSVFVWVYEPAQEVIGTIIATIFQRTAAKGMDWNWSDNAQDQWSRFWLRRDSDTPTNRQQVQEILVQVADGENQQRQDALCQLLTPLPKDVIKYIICAYDGWDRLPCPVPIKRYDSRGHLDRRAMFEESAMLPTLLPTLPLPMISHWF